MRTMTMRERMLAVLHGRPHDRVPFATYAGMEGLPLDEIRQILGPNQLGLLRYSMVHRVTYPNCQFLTEDFCGQRRQVDPATIHWAVGLRFPAPADVADVPGVRRWQRNTIHTSGGSLYEERCFEPAYNSSAVRKHFVERPEDYEILWSLIEDAVIEPDYDRFLQDRSIVGDDGLAMAWIERTPYQQLWVEWVGLDMLSYHLVDCADRVEHTMQLLQRQARRVFDIAARSPAPFVEIPDNITTPAIGARRFREYCVPLYNEIGSMLAERGALLFVHMDGELTGLWDAVADSRVGGIDSFTPAPDTGNTLEEAMAHCPAMRWWVNYPSSVHLRPPDEIRAVIDHILGLAGHTARLQVQVTENIHADTWRTSFPVITQAIEEFGVP